LGYSPNSPFLFQKIKKIFELKTKKSKKNNSSEKRMLERPENGKNLVEEVQKYKD
jgi:hypothetical protein